MNLRRSFVLVLSLAVAGCTMFHPPRWRITTVHRAADRQEEIQQERVGSIAVGTTDTGLPKLVDYRPAVIDETGKVRLGIVEFDDFGAFKDERQLTELCRYLRQRPPSAPKLLLVIFVHGWQHDADPHDQNLSTVRRMLSELQGQAWDEEVLGVYVAWPGNIRTLPEDRSGFVHTLQSLGTIPSFGARMNAAERVGRLACTEAMLAMISEAKAIDPDGSGPAKRELRNRERVKTVVIGHSMGGLIVERSFVQAMIGYNIINKPVQDQLDLVERTLRRSFEGIIKELDANEKQTVEQADRVAEAKIVEAAAGEAKDLAERTDRDASAKCAKEIAATDAKARELYEEFLEQPCGELVRELDAINQSHIGPTRGERIIEFFKQLLPSRKATATPAPAPHAPSPAETAAGRLVAVSPAPSLGEPTVDESDVASAEEVEQAFKRLSEAISALKQPVVRKVLELGDGTGLGTGYWAEIRADAVLVQLYTKDHEASKKHYQLCSNILGLQQKLTSDRSFKAEYDKYRAQCDAEAAARIAKEEMMNNTRQAWAKYESAKESHKAARERLRKLQQEREATCQDYDASRQLTQELDLARRGRIADLVLLGNPASEALVTQQFFDVWKPDRIGTQARLEGGEESDAQPLLITVSSPADRDTGVIFPLGSALFRRGTDGAADRTNKGKELVTRTAPQVDSLVTHWAGRGKPTVADFDRKRDPSRSGQRVVVTPNENRNPDLPEKAPLWVVKATPDLIHSHDILDDGFRDLVVTLVQQSGQLKPKLKDEVTALPCRVVPLAPGLSTGPELPALAEQL